MTKNIIFILISVCLTSCFKKEDAITLKEGSTIITSFYLGDKYEKQIYFDLSSNTFQEHQLENWDICFDANANGFGVYRNSGYGITVRKIDIYNLDEPNANSESYILQQKIVSDEPNGKAETSAFGDWRKYYIKDQSSGVIKNGIYVIELNYLTGIDRFRRLQIINSTDSTYACRITKLNQNTAPITEIKKNTNQNFTYYSFKNNGIIIDNAEPNKNTWDIQFTQYAYTFYKGTPAEVPNYPVRGVLNNPNKIEVYRDSAITDFDKIDGTYIKNLPFSSNRDAIGFDWKDFDRNGSSTYSVNAKITYIIKDTDGYYYKLRFLDYYNNLRERGYPKFEYIRIK